MTTFLRIAHRGASAEAPENTIPAIRLALEKYKVDSVEFDVRLSKDRVPVLIHDETLERTTNGNGRVRDHDLAELKQLQIITPSPNPSAPKRSAHLSVRYGAGARIEIPTLEEVLREFPFPFFIEIKDNDAAAGEKVLEVIQQCGRLNAPRVSRRAGLNLPYEREGMSDLANTGLIVGSFHSAPIHKIRGQDLDTALTRREVILAYTLFRLGFKSFSPPAPYASLPPKAGDRHLKGACLLQFDDPAWIEFLHRSGVKVFYWTVNDAEEAKELIHRGADGIVSDDPAVIARR